MMSNSSDIIHESRVILFAEVIPFAAMLLHKVEFPSHVEPSTNRIVRFHALTSAIRPSSTITKVNTQSRPNFQDKSKDYSKVPR